MSLMHSPARGQQFKRVKKGVAFAHLQGEGPLRPGLRVVTDLLGRPLEYICACGLVFWPTYWAHDCINYMAGSDRCIQPVGNHIKRKRPKYRKNSEEQANLEGLSVRKAFWGVEKRLTESVLDERV